MRRSSGYILLKTAMCGKFNEPRQGRDKPGPRVMLAWPYGLAAGRRAMSGQDARMAPPKDAPPDALA